MSSSKTLPVNNDTDNEEEYYDKLYFDSDTTDEEESDVPEASSKKSKKLLNQEQRKKLTNDELLYDPELDNQDELWMEKKLSRYSSKAKQKVSTSKSSEIPSGTDAILSCPLCFTPLSYHTQRHELYSNQYRAIFVENCKIIRTEKLLYNENRLRNKNRKSKNEELSNELITGQETYYSVVCETCGTKVAVIDEDEITAPFSLGFRNQKIEVSSGKLLDRSKRSFRYFCRKIYSYTVWLQLFLEVCHDQIFIQKAESRCYNRGESG
ncbi:unnamed protein product [Rhizophagus irregularis]|nr:unnamed protein product [Rhizophagus irregularis]CAB4412926.1 unnamed protein product [Rhizophagus irregularis]CAB5344604.1 unnamed protein product [Rhizophagus irregularis]